MTMSTLDSIPFMRTVTECALSGGTIFVDGVPCTPDADFLSRVAEAVRHPVSDAAWAALGSEVGRSDAPVCEAFIRATLKASVPPKGSLPPSAHVVAVVDRLETFLSKAYTLNGRFYQCRNLSAKVGRASGKVEWLGRLNTAFRMLNEAGKTGTSLATMVKVVPAKSARALRELHLSLAPLAEAIDELNAEQSGFVDDGVSTDKVVDACEELDLLGPFLTVLKSIVDDIDKSLKETEAAKVARLIGEGKALRGKA